MIYFYAFVMTVLAVFFATQLFNKRKDIPPDEVAKEKKRLEAEFARKEQAARKEITAAKMALGENKARCEKVVNKYIDDMTKIIMKSVTPNNFTASKGKIEKLFAFCEKSGFPISSKQQKLTDHELRAKFEAVLRADFQKKEQARIKAQIREEEKVRREAEKVAAAADREQKAIEKALAAALAKATDEHSAEIEALREKLKEAEEKGQRALSMAEQTKSGHVYVISNIGSFGEGVFKIGMTRRLEPLIRVRELGDASVPFPYDVHMMISCEDAPSLENALHRELHRHRLNKVNLRKEFFRSEIEVIADIVMKQHGQVEFVADPEALEYNQSVSMTDEDFDYVTHELAVVEGSEDFSQTSTDTDALDSGEQAEPIPGTDPQKDFSKDEDTAPCPTCGGPISISTLVPGNNTCPHCSGVFLAE